MTMYFILRDQGVTASQPRKLSGLPKPSFLVQIAARSRIDLITFSASKTSRATARAARECFV